MVEEKLEEYLALSRIDTQASVAQLAERGFCNAQVEGAIPFTSSNLKIK